MDERKKTIKELEDRKRENLESVNLMLADLGEQLLVRVNGLGEGVAADFGEPHIGEYQRFLKEIDDSEGIIRRIEADTARLKELEDDIQRKEQRNSGQTRELSASYIKLGEIVLEEPDFESFGVASRRDAEGYTAKIRSLEERLESFEDKNNANVFAWISKNAQGMVIRSFLAKTQDNLRRLYALAGENFFQTPPAEAAGHGEVNSLMKDIEDQRKESSELAAELSRLRGERRKLGDVFGVEGSPVKQIQGQEKHIRHIREELRALYLSFGERAADPQYEGDFSPVFQGDDRLILGRVEEIRGIIAGIEGQIEKLKASLAIDDEQAQIEKLKKSIEEYRERIAASEEAIVDLEGQIDEANRHIEELSLFLNDER